MPDFAVSSKVLVTPPAYEPISLAEAKQHLRVDGPDDDAMISALITMAREKIQSATNKALAPQTWDVFWDQFPGVPPYRRSDEIILPIGPVSSVTQFQRTLATQAQVNWTVSGNNLLNEFGVLNAHLNASSQPARIRLAYSCVWPSDILQTVNGLRIRCNAGYPAWGGTVTVNGTAVAAVTGAFDPTWTAGKRIVIGAQPAVIASVADATHLTILPLALSDALDPSVTYSFTVDNIPEMLRAAMKLLIGHLYENREAVTDGTLVVGSILPMGIDAMITDHKLWLFA